MNTPTLTPNELAVLRRLRISPCDADKLKHHLFHGHCIAPAFFLPIVQILTQGGLARVQIYHQWWRQHRISGTVHLTHAGRMALLQQEGAK